MAKSTHSEATPRQPRASRRRGPPPLAANRTLAFFNAQFERQIAAGELALNPFERAVLPFLSGRVLDLGCGLGNLARAAARQGCQVTALDASPAAIAHLARAAAAEHLPIAARRADLSHPLQLAEKTFDAVAAIGLLMFFPPSQARAAAAALAHRVKPGGLVAINVLIEGTTYMDMFEPGGYTLFGEHELLETFPGWGRELFEIAAYPAPQSAVKRFCTLVARRPLVR